MGQLLKENSKNILWSTGYSSFFISHQLNSWRLPVAVNCRLGNLESSDIALLDTGAEWSVIGGETAEILEDQLVHPIKLFKMSTRKGSISGSLYRIDISLLAEQNSGNDLTVESSVFVSEEWDGPIVLGYLGFLERIRFAIDPGMSVGEQLFYFGSDG